MEQITLSSQHVNLEFRLDGTQFDAIKYEANGASWLNTESSSDLFSFVIADQHWNAHNLPVKGWTIERSTNGQQHLIVTFGNELLHIEHHLVLYSDSALTEQWQIFYSIDAPLTITRMDSYSIDIPAKDYDLMFYDSDWGQEFESRRVNLQGNVTLETRKGRSSKGQHPWFSLFREDGQVLSGSVAWSGNWICRFEALPNGAYRLCGGLNEWSSTYVVRVGVPLETPHMIFVVGDNLNAVSQQYARVGRQFWYPRTALTDSLPVEWNHWWSYEDVEINEAVYLQNMEIAASMGMELCTLDAGWFGVGPEWHLERGDWHLVNHERFPSGIRALSDATHAKGLKFGFWCEIEGLGAKAALATSNPSFVARRDGQSLGYVCFGNPEVQEWAFQTLSRIIRDYDCDWLKLDFNVDPEAGCNRADHGHTDGAGLFEHYHGYYAVLKRIRDAFPEVALENCSSGGLRIDLGMMQQTNLTFLSDPDWPAHDLQVFWGASTMLAPNVCLHWSFSEWRGEGRPKQQNFNPRDPNLKSYQLDYYTHMAMLGVCGFCQKLPELPRWIVDRLTYHIQIYKTEVRRFIREADVYRLTEQPRRNGDGERWSAFQYSLPNKSDHLLFIFRLPGAELTRTIRLLDLESERLYTLSDLDGKVLATIRGEVLIDTGILFDQLREEESVLLHLY